MLSRDEFIKKVAARVREIRTEKGMSQVALAEDSKKIRQVIQKVEKGTFSPSAYLLYEIAQGLEVDLKDILDF